MDWFWQGVVIGATVALLRGLYGIVAYYARRRRQIRYIRMMVKAYGNMLLDDDALVEAGTNRKTPPTRAILRAVLEDFLRAMDLCVAHRSSALSDTQAHLLRMAHDSASKRGKRELQREHSPERLMYELARIPVFRQVVETYIREAHFLRLELKPKAELYRDKPILEPA